MKIVLTSLALGAGLAVAAPALAADTVATGKPTELAQQATQQKAKQAKSTAKKDATQASAKAKAKTMAKSKPQ